MRAVSSLIFGFAAKESPNTTMLFVAACAGAAARGVMRDTSAIVMTASLVLMVTGGVSLVSVFENKVYAILCVYFCQIGNLPIPQTGNLQNPTTHSIINPWESPT